MQDVSRDDEVTIVEDFYIEERVSDEIIFVDDEEDVNVGNELGAGVISLNAESIEQSKRPRTLSDDVIIVSDQPSCSNCVGKRFTKNGQSTSEVVFLEDKQDDVLFIKDNRRKNTPDDVIIIDDLASHPSSSAKKFPLNSSIECQSKKVSKHKENKERLVTLKKRQDRIFQVLDVDMQSLSDKKCISGGVINCYLQVLYQKLPEEQRSSYHIFLTYFYERLLRWDLFSKSGNQWTRDIDLFSKKVVIFPICEGHHWFLVVVCNPGLLITSENRIDDSDIESFKPSIVILCSLGLEHQKAVSIIRNYLKIELHHQKQLEETFDSERMPNYVPNVPQQPNGHDCGIYLLHFAELILENPFPFLEAEIPDLSNWFTFEDIRMKRYQIKSTILEKGLVSEGS